MAQYIRLLIKGPQAEAERTLAQREVPYKEAWGRKGAVTNSTMAIIPYSDALVEVAQRWMAEQPAIIQGYGYPDGTLLWFTIENRNEDEWK